MNTNTATLPAASLQWNSIYIPILPKDLMLENMEINNEETIKDYFENKLQFGKVSRVDFITKASKTDGTAISVFIHFETWNEYSISFREHMEKQGEYKLYGINNNTPFVSSKNKNIKRFITLKINKTPIPEVKEVPKNMHQIVNNYALMEKLIEEQKQKIKELEDMVTLLKNELIITNYEKVDVEMKEDVEFENVTIRREFDCQNNYIREKVLY